MSKERLERFIASWKTIRIDNLYEDTINRKIFTFKHRCKWSYGWVLGKE